MRDVLAMGPSPFAKWEHYPKGDAEDLTTGYGWYYHAHPLAGAEVADEHGHFHLYCAPRLLSDAMPMDAPAPGSEAERDGICHLLSISMDMKGRPHAIFAINRLASDQWIFHATAMPAVIQKFALDAPTPCTETSAWIAAFLKTRKTDIALLLADRDAALAASVPDATGRHKLVFVSRNLA